MKIHYPAMPPAFKVEAPGNSEPYPLFTFNQLMDYAYAFHRANITAAATEHETMTEVARSEDYYKGLYEKTARALELRQDATPTAAAEVSDAEMEQIADAIWGAQKKRLPMAAAIQFARAILALRTAGSKP